MRTPAGPALALAGLAAAGVPSISPTSAQQRVGPSFGCTGIFAVLDASSLTYADATWTQVLPD